MVIEIYIDPVSEFILIVILLSQGLFIVFSNTFILLSEYTDRDLNLLFKRWLAMFLKVSSLNDLYGMFLKYFSKCKLNEKKQAVL